MIVLKCSGCGIVQSSGKFCQSCGGKMVESKLDAPQGVKFKAIHTTRSIPAIQGTIKKLLKRIGVKEKDVSFSSNGTTSTVNYILDTEAYSFTSFLQKNETCNWAAVEQFLNGRVLGIERGIETKKQAFSGYARLGHAGTPRALLGVPEHATREECEAAYRKLAKMLHTDVGGNDEQFSKINTAIQQIRTEKS